MDHLTLHLVTPSSTLFSGEVTLVTAPGAIGDFGVMAGHMPFVSALKPGVLRIEQGNNVANYFVAGGVAEVNEKGMTVLADESIALENVDRAHVEQRLRDARAQLSIAENEQEKAVAGKSVQIAEALLEAIAA